MTKPDKDKDKKNAAPPATDWPFVENILQSELVRTVYLYGPPGIGKTYSAYHCGRINDGVYAITLTEDTPASELRGHYLPRGGEIVWHDGPFTAAMRAGARLVVNELTHAAPDVQALLYPVLESFATARLTLPSNETVRPAPGFHVICTDNAPPTELPAALQDRFDCTIEIGEPHPTALAQLSEPLRRAALRALALEPERRIGLRQWLAVERLRGAFGLLHACLAVFGANRGAQIHDAITLAGANE